VGIILVVILLQTSYIESDVVDAITESQVTSGKPIVVCTIGGEFTNSMLIFTTEPGTGDMTPKAALIDSTAYRANLSRSKCGMHLRIVWRYGNQSCANKVPWFSIFFLSCSDPFGEGLLE
jgi:hypothetical protein